MRRILCFLAFGGAAAIAAAQAPTTTSTQMPARPVAQPAAGTPAPGFVAD